MCAAASEWFFKKKTLFTENSTFQCLVGPTAFLSTPHPFSRELFFGCCPLFLNETLTFDVQHQDQITTRDYFTVGEKNSIWPRVQIPLHCSFTKTKIIIKTRLGTSYRPIKELWKITGPEKKNNQNFNISCKTFEKCNKSCNKEQR